MAYTLVLLRHGQSQWNLENRFTGWVDVPLTEKGIEEAKRAGKKLKENNHGFEVVHTNMLKRAIKTTWLALEELDMMWVPVYKTWRLNERHYGALSGLNKAETAAKYGEEQVKLWRRGYDTLPPLLETTDMYYPGSDPRYKDLSEQDIPRGESLELTLKRVLPYWNDTIIPQVKEGKRVLVSASHNSLRAIVKQIDSMTPKDILELTIPTGIPLVYELDEQLNPIKHYYLASDEELKAAIDEVKNQGKVQ